MKPHSLYMALGLDDTGRQRAYRELFRDELELDLVNEIRRAINGNFALGNERFVVQVSAALGLRAVPGSLGDHVRLNLKTAVDRLIGELSP
ncbi:hypothetical protein [Nitrosomonas sp. Is37]|uniref:hypothetical protein n=1 Tax=Nitrosomonas sp. Is37 TaxID=3080535 RepID=UPI00294B8081|nr:hypothetical protein [Nitrosomonas sp. Is37]